MRLLTCLLLATGCASAPLEGPPLEFSNIESNLVIDDAFSADERAGIEEGWAWWQFATGGSFEYTARHRNDSRLWRVVRESGPFLGETRTRESLIAINADGITPPDGQPFRAEAFLGLVLHEMGHAAGIRAHSPAVADEGGHIPGTVMDENVLLSCIDPVGLDAVCDLRGCAERRATCQ